MENMIKLGVSLLIFCVIKNCTTEETFCSINGKKALNKVSEKFLSVTIDPAILLTGINLSDTSLLLAKNLAPAYIRLAGPSTQYVKFAQKDLAHQSYLSGPESYGNIFATPSIWFGINEWFNLASLTPVFGINDAHKDESGIWNAKEVLPLLELSDRLNFSCFWQLGFDCSGKTAKQYVDDLKALRSSLNNFPNHNETWKIVASDISKCFSQNLVEDKGLKDTVEAVMWESDNKGPWGENMKNEFNLWTTIPKSTKSITFGSALQFAKEISEIAKNGYKVAFKEPRLHELSSDTPVYWFSFLHKQLMGTIVLDAKMSPSYPDTVIYAHCSRKQNSFVRRGAITVLIVNEGNENFTANVRLSLLSNEKTMEIQSYVLTSENENSTDTFLNDEKVSMDILQTSNFLKPKLRRTKTSAYVSLQVSAKSIGFFVLTNARAPVCIEQEEEIYLILEEINIDQQLPLSKEINFDISSRGAFSKNDVETLERIRTAMLNELESDEKFFSQNNKMFNLNTVKESNPNEKVDNAIDKKLAKNRQLFLDRVKQRKPEDLEKKREELKQLLKQRLKPIQKETGTGVEQKEKPLLLQDDKKPQIDNMELTSEEIKSILRKRAKAVANKRRIKFSSQELDALLDKTIKTHHRKYKRDINRILLEERWKMCNCKQGSEEIHDLFKENTKKHVNANLKRSIPYEITWYKRTPRSLRNSLVNQREPFSGKRQKLRNIKQRLQQRMSDIKRARSKRDINMDLLKRKSETITKKKVPTKHIQTLFKDQEEREATIRLPGQTSGELFKESSEESVGTFNIPKIPSEIYAELATNNDDGDVDDYESNSESEEKPTIHSKKIIVNPLFNRKPVSDKLSLGTRTKKSKKNKTVEEEEISSDEALQFLSPSAEFDDIEDDLPSIHEFFGQKYIQPKNKISEKKKTTFDEIWEYKMPVKRGRANNDKKNMREMEEISFSDDYESDDFKVRRKKREADDVPKDNENYKTYKKYMEGELRQLKQQVEDDKERYEEEKLQNRLLLGEIKENGVKDNNVIVNDGQKEKLKYLRKLKSKLSKRKETLHMLHRNNKKVKEMLDKSNEILNSHNKSLIPKNNVSQTVHVAKRSAYFDKDLFGNYQPLTSVLKPWTPSDILGLKRYQFLTAPYIPQFILPPYDNNVLKNLHFNNDYFNFRRKRSISKEINSIENQIDEFVNKIQKETEKYIRPAINFTNGDYQLILPNKDELEIKAESGKTKFGFVHQNEHNRNNSSGTINVTSNANKYKSDIDSSNSNRDFINGAEFTTLSSGETSPTRDGNSETTTIADDDAFNPLKYIEKIRTQEEEKLVTFFDKVAETFHDFGRKVKSYLHNILR